MSVRHCEKLCLSVGACGPSVRSSYQRIVSVVSFLFFRKHKRNYRSSTKGILGEKSLKIL